MTQVNKLVSFAFIKKLQWKLYKAYFYASAIAIDP
jgi:hypothetical protein